jgi:hypothetical protein
MGTASALQGLEQLRHFPLPFVGPLVHALEDGPELADSFMPP